ncbi:MAG: thiamine phosphate synthase [Hyphomicrobiaceae bacterium]|nr:thiamine phosphate synthase [Hyphomicrobiaceae bacterium]
MSGPGGAAGRGVVDLFYPIVPDVGWLARIVPLGVRTIQLRLKDAAAPEISRQITKSLDICAAHGCDLIVNDYWREAIVAGASWVHLGQEDLAAADLSAIRAAGLRFGLSTHDEAELRVALAANPDYIALGPIYETTLKAMRWQPQGLARVTTWKALIGATPLVAIGGITPDRATGVVAAGADSVAVITDFLTSVDPEARISTWLNWRNATVS